MKLIKLISLLCIIIQSLSINTLYATDTMVVDDDNGNYEFAVFALASGEKYADANAFSDSDKRLIVSPERFLKTFPAHALNADYSLCIAKKAKDNVYSQAPEGFFDAIQQGDYHSLAEYGISPNDFYQLMILGVASKRISPERFLDFYPNWREARGEHNNKKRAREKHVENSSKKSKTAPNQIQRKPETIRCLAAVEKFLNDRLEKADCQALRIGQLSKLYNQSDLKFRTISESTFRLREKELRKKFTKEQHSRYLEPGDRR